VIPALPWKAMATPDGDSEYVVMASLLPLRRFRATFRFLSYVRAVRRQLRGADGLIGYSLWAKPLARRYWTLSVWKDQSALAAFMRDSPHAQIMVKLRPDVQSTRFVRWTTKGSDIPVAWQDALRHLDAVPDQ
jgi:quinol monooxygenase YgiN